MSTLTYSRDLAAAAGAAKNTGRRPFWRRVFDSMVESRQRRADREIAAFLQTRGGVFNDDTEREIMDRIAGRRRSSI